MVNTWFVEAQVIYNPICVTSPQHSCPTGMGEWSPVTVYGQEMDSWQFGIEI